MPGCVTVSRAPGLPSARGPRNRSNGVQPLSRSTAIGPRRHRMRRHPRGAAGRTRGMENVLRVRAHHFM